MQTHFSSFTPEAMRAFGQELAAGFQSRREFLDKTRNHTVAMLANFRRVHREAESQRRQRAAREADERRLFMSELRSGVHALKNRFELGRHEMAADFRQMAGELRAASEAFRNRPGHPAGSFLRRPVRYETAAEGHHVFEAQEGTRSRFAHGEKLGKKRHG
ncbi:MAG: hypothetical protein PHU25_17840 [Deltaproteobacteria bacterium]|nr:hypothetical protein [Deltaproteobacteria bacterium]